MPRNIFIGLTFAVAASILVAGCKKDPGSPTLPSTYPTVTSLSPNFGPPEGGTAVTIRGSGFASGASVTFGGNAATNVAFVDSGTLTATTPSYQGAGAVSVVVTNPDGKSHSFANGYTYTIVYTGTWNGTTDQYWPYYTLTMSMVVDENNVIRAFDCNIATTCDPLYVAPINYRGSQTKINPDGTFSWTSYNWSFQGKFESATSASGTARDRDTTPCNYDVTVKWTATKS